MATRAHLTQDDILFVLFSAAYTMTKPGSFTTQQEIGRWVEQGFVWTTEYIVKHERFFAKEGHHEPDGFIKFQPGKLLVTVEVTANPRKKNLQAQLEFFSSNEYHRTVVGQDSHELWFFVPRGIEKSFRETLEKCLSESHLERKLPIVLWAVDFDRKRGLYVIGKTYEKAEPGVPRTGVPLDRVEVPIPPSYPLLSSKLSTPAVVFAIGTEFTKTIMEPAPAKRIEDVWRDFRPNAVRLAHFHDCVGFLTVLVPDLVEFVREGGERLVRVKNNPGRIKSIRKQLSQVRAMQDKTAVEQAAQAAARAKARKPREKPATRLERETTTLDQFLEDEG